MELDPYSHKGWYNRAVVKIVIRDFPGALADFTSALSFAPENERDLSSDAYAALGNIYYQLQDYSEAKKNLGQAIATNPNNPRATFMRGQVNQAIGDKQAAIRDFQKTLE
jgi:tetratricopeptide (TPR) repeat protein